MNDNYSSQQTPEDILVKLTNALKTDGDFPASAKVVNKLKELTNDPRTTAQQLAEVILHEPSLSTRILHLVNSSFYRRSKPIMTVGQAVVAVGMKAIADMCAGLVLLQRFIPVARKGGPFADCFKRSMVTSLLSSSFSAEIGGKSEGSSNELGYISGFFSEIGTVLLGYYFPKIYETAVSRAKFKNITLAESLYQITGHTPTAISIEVISALGMPPFYVEVIKASSDAKRLAQKSIRSLDEEKIVVAGRSVGAGLCVSAAIEEGDTARLERALARVHDEYGIETDTSMQVIRRLNEIFRDHCAVTEIELPPLPEFLKTFAGNTGEHDLNQPLTGDVANEQVKFFSFIDEIKTAVQNREPAASIITSVMEALKFGLLFDRVILMLFDAAKKNIGTRMALGVEGFRPGNIVKPIDAKFSSPESIALRDGKVVFQGDSLLENGYPFVFMPIGTIKKGLGIIYADRSPAGAEKHGKELDERARANISMLADLVDRSLGGLK